MQNTCFRKFCQHFNQKKCLTLPDTLKINYFNCLLVKKTSELARTARMFQLAQRFCLNLADTLTGNVKLLSDLLQSVVSIHSDTKTHSQNTLFPRRQ